MKKKQAHQKSQSLGTLSLDLDTSAFEKKMDDLEARLTRLKDLLFEVARGTAKAEKRK